MGYTIGIGALFDPDGFSAVRSIQLALLEQIGDASSLIQPPHVTVKRPFQVPDVAGIGTVKQLVRESAQQHSPFNITLSSIGQFDETALYLAAQSSDDSLEAIHKDLLEKTNAVFPASRAPFEDDSMVFHATLSLKPGDDTERIVQSFLTEGGIVCAADRLGLFLSLDDGAYWSIIYEWKLDLIQD